MTTEIPVNNISDDDPSLVITAVVKPEMTIGNKNEFFPNKSPEDSCKSEEKSDASNTQQKVSKGKSGAKKSFSRTTKKKIKTKSRHIENEGHEPVKCEVCHKQIKKSCGLSTHMKFHALGHDIVGKDTPIACEECGKSFKTKQEHRQHFSRVHIGARTKLCPMSNCTKMFKSNGEVKAHLRTHTKR